MKYIHNRRDWPRFHCDQDKLASQLAEVRHRQGRLSVAWRRWVFPSKKLTLDVLKSSEIEGEKLNLEQVRSSIARRLGMDIDGAPPADRHTEGVIEMMLDATQNFAQPLSAERLFGWHAAMFPTGRSGMHKIVVGSWRDDAKGPMQVVSGPIGHEKVLFEAPKAERLDGEMQTFINWANATGGPDPVLRAAQAHLWFVTIHPLDDGNGRVARAIADWALARSENSPQRFLQHVGANPAGTRQLLHDPGAHADRHARHHRIQALIEQGLLVKDAGGGRNTSYSLVE